MKWRGTGPGAHGYECFILEIWRVDVMGTEAGAPPGCGYEYFDVIDVVGRDLERIGGAPAPVPVGTNVSYWAGYFPT